MSTEELSVLDIPLGEIFIQISIFERVSKSHEILTFVSKKMPSDVVMSLSSTESFGLVG